MRLDSVLILVLAVCALASVGGSSSAKNSSLDDILVESLQLYENCSAVVPPSQTPSLDVQPRAKPDDRTVSDNDRWAALSKMYYWRTSVRASDMRLACWEARLAYYASVAGDQCSYISTQSDAFRQLYDLKVFPVAKVMRYVLVAESYYTVSEILQGLFDRGVYSLEYKVLMNYDLRAFGCDTTLCPSYLNDDGMRYTNVFSYYCFFIYKSDFSTAISGLPYTPGERVCSRCDTFEVCDNDMCRGSYSDLPGVGVCQASTYTTTTTQAAPGAGTTTTTTTPAPAGPRSTFQSSLNQGWYPWRVGTGNVQNGNIRMVMAAASAAYYFLCQSIKV